MSNLHFFIPTTHTHAITYPIEEEAKKLLSPTPVDAESPVTASTTTEATVEEKEETTTNTTPTTPATTKTEMEKKKHDDKKEVHTPTSAIVGANSNNSRLVSVNAFASGSNANGAQVMTGRPTSRVLAPPGGHTSIKLG